jgi:predicted negative regulator of RcsB-dependent stress response
MYFERACAYEGLGQWEAARGDLAQVLMAAEPGPLAQEAGLHLARVSLKMGQPDKAIALCRQVLDAASEESIRRRAAGILATAYEERQEYGRAAESLVSPSGQGGHGREAGSPQSPSKEVIHVEG